MILIVRFRVVLNVVPMVLPLLAMAALTWTIWLFRCSLVLPVGPVALLSGCLMLEKLIISVFLENTPILNGAL